MVDVGLLPRDFVVEPSVNAIFQVTLKQTDRGHMVGVLQALLRLAGEDVEESGIFDHQTRLVLMKFQRRRGVKVDEMGKTNSATWISLLQGEQDAANNKG